MKQHSNYLAQIVHENGLAKITRVHRVVGLNKQNEPKLKQINARNFSRQLNKSQLVIN